MESDISVGKVIGTQLRITLLTEIGSLTMRVKGGHSSSMDEQGNCQRTLSDYA